MDYNYKGNNFQYYNNYNNIGNMDLDQFYNFNETSFSHENYIKDLMFSGAKQKRQKKSLIVLIAI